MQNLTLLAVSSLIICVFLCFQVQATLTTTANLSMGGSISTYGVQVQEPSITWGMIAPEATASYLIHVRSNGTAPVTLSFAVNSATPANLMNYMRFGWNYSDGTYVNQTWIPIMLKLQVFTNATQLTDTMLAAKNSTNFSFSITITGSS